MKYRKKQVEIEAIRFLDDSYGNLVAIGHLGLKPNVLYNPLRIEIETLEGTMTANIGDFIIKGVNGEFYPCKADVFDKTYIRSDTLDFSQALFELKQGHKVARKGWNGKGILVVARKGYPNGIPCNKQTAEELGVNEGELFKCGPYLQIKNVHGSFDTWIPSISDLFAEDWEVIK